MKNHLVIIAVLALLACSCKTKQHSKPIDPNSGTAAVGKTVGTVSHQYKSTGCATVIIVKTEDAANPLVLIPKDALVAGLDKDGLELYFDYRLLKMPNPDGCTHGIMAELTNIAKK
ncbi:MAG: hypothetical protein WCQ95_07975 [Bacteroidota bacterium]